MVGAETLDGGQSLEVTRSGDDVVVRAGAEMQHVAPDCSDGHR